jgi:hypothetical protein
MKRKTIACFLSIVVIALIVTFTGYAENKTTSSTQNIDKLWEDDSIGIVLDTLERTDDYPSELKGPGDRISLPKEGHDFVVIYLTITRIEKIHMVSLGGRGQEQSTLYDAKGHSYKLSTWHVKGVKILDPHDITSPKEFIEGAKGYLIFEIPKHEKPAKLTFVYYFKESWEDKSTKRGQIDIKNLISQQEAKQKSTVDLSAFVKEIMKLKMEGNRIELAMWLPFKFYVEANLAEGGQTRTAVERDIGFLKPYLTLIVQCSIAQPDGSSLYSSEKEVRARAVLKLADGTEIRPLDKVPPMVSSTAAAMKVMMASEGDPGGANMHVLVFPTKNKQGQSIVDTAQKDKLMLVLKADRKFNETIFTWHTPFDATMAQIKGKFVDKDTGRPLQITPLLLLTHPKDITEDEQAELSAAFHAQKVKKETDNSGAFSIVIVNVVPGKYALFTKRYGILTPDFAVSPGEVVDLGTIKVKTE